MPAPDTIRQKIVDAYKLALEGISTDDGYATDAGALVAEWQGTPFGQDELNALPSKCALILRDLDEPIKVSTRFSKRHDRSLHMQVEVVGVGALAAETYRLVLSDIERALLTLYNETDDSWFDGLAYDVRPRLSRLAVLQESMRIAGGFHECFVDYITRAFNSYET